MKKPKMLLKKLTKIRNDPDIELWAIDEVIFQLHGSVCRMWVPKDVKDPIIHFHPTRKSVGYFGAVRLSDGKFVYQRPYDRFNGETFMDFMKYLRMITARSKKRNVFLLDNARYHHWKEIKVWTDSIDEKFSLIFLPPYSPELNPIERVWKLVRRTSTHNRYFPNLDELEFAVEKIFWSWHRSSGVLVKLCA
jgi:transposase